jgi:hypothetical protein
MLLLGCVALFELDVQSSVLTKSFFNGEHTSRYT